MAQKWTLGKKGIRRNKIWLISFGRLSSNLWWTPEWEAQLDI